MALIHGGQLQKVAAAFNIAESNWLDLSTGIAPYSYPIPDIPTSLWQQLPQPNEQLTIAAQHYYQAQQLLVTNGSQAVIKALPSLWRQQCSDNSIVYLPLHGYKEHQQAWVNAGYTVAHYHEQLPELAQLTPHCVLVVINPNNPTGKLFNRDELTDYQLKIDKLGGLLVLDEAFMDVITPTQSLSSTLTAQSTLILRSFGKFFGLAGIRIGFVVANQHWLKLLNETLGPWQVNGPAQYIAQHALQNISWQQQQQSNLINDSQQLSKLLFECFAHDSTISIKGTTLFQTVTFSSNTVAPLIYQALCQRGIYVRLADNQQALRFGIPCPEQLPRLGQTLKKILKSCR
ncbi:threonine-phosphate decarboxylase CobD [Psychrobium sp. 1_MG-2023]|uniref:threonine-phosphate decarboxylase CobD n=1 Tax=Psychrobium sp. 1_MG-2023 TaxID=3062624 RepID=UPI0027367D31|nr:threonine-phosphate decarboxylase CobD [Psychrobium sp. 1_MG-2023]MDP2560436.1 threonine-phosphate decarboxylase CobD [Psychrobium sp. 1_MG-2023]